MSENTPKQKKSRLCGWLAFLPAFAGIVILVYLGMNGVLSVVQGEIPQLNVGNLLLFVKVVCGLGAISFLISIVGLFLRKQKKGLCIFCLIVSIILMLVSGSLLYGFYYIFGTMEQDTEFNKLTSTDLYIPPVREEDGAFDQNYFPDVETRPAEEVKEEIDEMFNKIPEEDQSELDWDYLVDSDIPGHIRPYMDYMSPLGKSYLLPGHEQIQNVMLFGLDRYLGCDSTMVMSIDHVHHKIKLISIARDSYVWIPGWGGYTKLTHAYSWGQAPMAVGTINYNFKLNIDNYISVRFADLEAIINMAGGVDVYLDAQETDYMHAYSFSHLQEGMNHLNGIEALTYSRMRKSGKGDSDFKRSQRQQEVLSSLYQSAQNMPLSSVPQFAREGMRLCKTSLQVEQLLDMLLPALSAGYTMERHSLVDYVKSWGGQFGPVNGWYLVYDLDYAGDVMYRLIYEGLYVSGYDH